MYNASLLSFLALAHLYSLPLLTQFCFPCFIYLITYCKYQIIVYWLKFNYSLTLIMRIYWRNLKWGTVSRNERPRPSRWRRNAKNALWNLGKILEQMQIINGKNGRMSNKECSLDNAVVPVWVFCWRLYVVMWVDKGGRGLRHIHSFCLKLVLKDLKNLFKQQCLSC